MEHLSEAVASRKTGKYTGLTYDNILSFLENNRDFKPIWSFAGKAISKDMENTPLGNIYLTFKNYEDVPKEQNYMYGKLSRGNSYIMVSGTFDSINGDIPVMYIEFDNYGTPFFFTLRFYEPEGMFDFYQQGQASDMKRMEKNLRKIMGV